MYCSFWAECKQSLAWVEQQLFTLLVETIFLYTKKWDFFVDLLRKFSQQERKIMLSFPKTLFSQIHKNHVFTVEGYIMAAKLNQQLNLASGPLIYPQPIVLF